MSEQMQSESFVLLRNDLKLAEKYPRRDHDYNEAVGCVVALASIPLLVLGCVAAAVLDVFAAPYPWLLLGLALGATIHDIQLLREWRARCRALTQDSQGWKRGPWRVTITPEGIRLESSQAILFQCWSTIMEIDGTADHAILLTCEREAIVVPRRAFASKVHFDSFVRQACRYCQADERRPPDDKANQERMVLPLPNQSIPIRTGITRREPIHHHA